jgi:hypothetical protein
MKDRSIAVLIVGAALGVAGCSGGGSNPSTPNGTGGTGGGPGPDPNSTCRPDGSLASARISLLSEEEYRNVVRDAFGVEFVPEKATVATGDYPLDEHASISTVDVAKKFHRAAEQVASKLKPCGEAAVDALCVESFLRQKLPRAWKRPVTDAEVGALMSVFNGASSDGPERALMLLMQAALGSSSFLYRTEIGNDASGLSGSVAMTPYELANAISFSMLRSVPDDSLWAKAVDGSITQPAVLSAEVDRLLALPAARENLSEKVSFYLYAEKIPVASKDAATFPEFTGSLQNSLYQSAKMFIEDLVWNGQVADLFTSTKYYANQEIAALYGLPPVQGSGLVEVQMPPERNAGILSQPGLLATTNFHAASDDIVHRGLWIYEALACGSPLGAPPAGALDVANTLTGTDRQKSEQRLQLAACGGCHAFFDPFGWPSMQFDAIGRYRTIDPQDNLPVVTTSEIRGLGEDLDGPVATLKDIADRLRSGRRVADCAADHLAEYTLDHNPAAENSCALQQIKNDFAASGKFVDLFKAILTSPAFATRDLSNQ